MSKIKEYNFFLIFGLKNIKFEVLNSKFVSPPTLPSNPSIDTPLPSSMFFLALSWALVETSLVSTFLGLKALQEVRIEIEIIKKKPNLNIFFTLNGI